MKIFISLLLLTSCVYVAVGVKLKHPDCMKVCKPSEPLCIHIKQPKQEGYPYTFMSKCELERFNCDTGRLGKVVPMKMCKVLGPTRTPKDVQRNIHRNKRDAVELTAKLEDQDGGVETNYLNNNGTVTDIEFRRSDSCQESCPADGVMVCGRCHHGVFRTFMSACYLRLYQCKHPDDKLEMVAWRPCLESGPYRGKLSRPKSGKEAPYDGNDPVFDFILARSWPNKAAPFKN